MLLEPFNCCGYFYPCKMKRFLNNDVKYETAEILVGVPRLLYAYCAVSFLHRSFMVVRNRQVELIVKPRGPSLRQASWCCACLILALARNVLISVAARKYHCT